MIIKCTAIEKNLLKRSIKANECKGLVCDLYPCDKPEDMTCGEYIISMITWEMEGKQ